jgi:uncharacterized protein YabN with tetrapyrrole methylase and pyrophosphatase domain
VEADALARALRLQRRVARQGFDWPRGDPALWDKLVEEIAELKAARRNRWRAAEELGDLLFMVVNLARHLGVHPGRALAAAIRKFERRYAHVMQGARSLPPRGDARRLQAMEERWQQAKRLERRKRRGRS